MILPKDWLFCQTKSPLSAQKADFKDNIRGSARRSRCGYYSLGEVIGSAVASGTSGAMVISAISVTIGKPLALGMLPVSAGEPGMGAVIPGAVSPGAPIIIRGRKF